ncbi:MAG: methylmalonyl-CoA mutase [Candidatus Syntrophoarchaeum sp. GoM_oil]|nr:MAG: methylmalonyl-CoA mutase [Candidatus Syntrophoarchaeum sp. GoM_oil]
MFDPEKVEELKKKELEWLDNTKNYLGAEKDENVFSASGIPLKRVYTPADIEGLDYEKDLNFPGLAPYTRGIYPTMYRGKFWTIRQFTGYNTPEETNERFKYEYKMGQTGFSIAFDAVTESGLDSTDPRAQDDIGTGGVHVDYIGDMDAMFADLPIDKVTTAVIATPWTSCPLSAMYFAVAEDRGISLDVLGGTTQNDLLLFTCCCHLVEIIPPHDLIRLSVDLIEWSAQNVPNWHPVSIASYNYRENGITAYQEIGFLLAVAIAYIEEELSRDRLTIDEFAPTISFHLSSHNDFFEEVAKFRAARRMWYKLITERYKAKDPKSAIFRFHVQTAGSTLVYHQPLNNSIRVAYQVLAAALGGVQSMHANSYDEPICLPTEQSILLSIRTQQIAQNDCNIPNVADPLGGSYYVEWLTNEVEELAWNYLQKIEDNGGLVACIESGWVHQEFARAMMKHARSVESGEKQVVGQNCYKMDYEPYEIPIFYPEPEDTADIQKKKIEKLKLERDSEKVETALDELKSVSEAKENVMPAVITAVKAGATLGEVCDVWRDIYGIWKIPFNG